MKACRRILGRGGWALPLLALAVPWPVGAAAAPNAVAVAAPVGQPAPDFALPAASGPNVRLSEYIGQPVILTFWRSDCGLCAAQLRQLDHLSQVYRSSGLIVLAVSVDDDLQRARRYAASHRTSFPMLLDQAKSVAQAYRIVQLPTTVLIDRSGTVRYLHQAYRSGDPSYVLQIRALLDDDAPSDSQMPAGGD